jgi:hypothetical protein
MGFRSFILPSFSALILASLLGCASFGGGRMSGINWALEKNGGRVSVFSEEPDHPASTLINGITSSQGWNQGEGWQAPITRGSGGGRRSSSARRDEQERYWVIIDLSQPVTVSHVRIYTIDSEEFPAEEFGISDLLVQYELETASKDMIWANAEKFGKGIGDQDNVIRDNLSGVIDVRFQPVNTQRIRILIYGTNDMARTEDDSRAREGLIRLTEVEVYGSGKHEARDDLETIFEQ